MRSGNAPQHFRLMASDIQELLPPVPQTVEETGLPYALIQDLVLRRLFLTSSTSGLDLADSLHLPWNGVVETVIANLYRDKLLEFKGGQGYGRPYFDYSLTEAGRERARDAFERCTYVGPAPVPLPLYVSLTRRQSREPPRVIRSDLEAAFHDMVMEPAFMEKLGPCVNSVRSLFLYGAPGNGKTSIAERIATILKGEIFVPYAIEIDSQIVKVHDPLIHRAVPPLAETEAGFDGLEDERTPTDDDVELATMAGPEALAQLRRLSGLTGEEGEDGTTVEVSLPKLAEKAQARLERESGRVVALPPFDRRFVLSYRPTVVVGGELTLEALDLTWSPTGRFYEAPFQVKACCGMMLIDDFGRQKVHPTDLLNRWIVPLEKRIDFLTLMTGKKFEVPFELLVIFSTNLDPSKLVDEAFLRRIRYKLEVPDPSERIFRGIFRKEAQRQGVRFDAAALDFVIQKYYTRTGRHFRGCHPRDILQLVVDLARFLQQEPAMQRRLLEQAADSYFVHMEGDSALTALTTVAPTYGASTGQQVPAGSPTQGRSGANPVSGPASHPSTGQNPPAPMPNFKVESLL